MPICIYAYACVHKCEYINVETLNIALVKCMRRKHKHVSPLPALSPQPAQRHVQGSWGVKTLLHVIVQTFFSYSEQWQRWLFPGRHCVFMSLLFSLENSFRAPCGPQALSVMKSCCPNINTTSIGWTGLLGHSAWPFRFPYFHPRDWSMAGPVTQTRPICLYPETDSWTLETRCRLWLIRLLVPVIHLSLCLHLLPCNFAVPPVKM